MLGGIRTGSNRCSELVGEALTGWGFTLNWRPTVWHPEVGAAGGGKKQTNALDGLLRFPLGCWGLATDWEELPVAALETVCGIVRLSRLSIGCCQGESLYC